MQYYMYVSLQDDDRIAIFTVDGETGRIFPQGDEKVIGGPAPLLGVGARGSAQPTR